MNLNYLVFQHQNRYKFWNWDEVFVLCGLTPTQAQQSIDSKNYQLNDPLSTLVYSHKNHNEKALDNIFDNYTHSQDFELRYNPYGISSKFVLQAKDPIWQTFNDNSDWYWKQNWIYKYGQLLSIFPGVKKIYLGCSASLENSHYGSDIDLIIQAEKNYVWITKAYFAILSKMLKYYDMNFGLAIYYLITRQIKKLEQLKTHTVENKIKIDFGLVFEEEFQLKKYYSNRERNIFVWSALKFGINNTKSQEKINSNNFQSGSINCNQILNPFVFDFIKLLVFPTILIIFPFGIINYIFEQKNKKDYNKLVLWSIYSQYNLVY